MAKELAKKEENALATIDFGNDLAAGFEDCDSSSFAIPFLRQLQSLSPQCKKSDPDYIKGAEEGDFVNTVSGKLYKGEDGVYVIPCKFVHKFNLWEDNRGGFRGSLTLDEYANTKRRKNEKGEEVTEDGLIIKDSREHYVLVVDGEGGFERALLALSGSQIKTSKKWMTMQQAIVDSKRIPMQGQVYKLTATSESNDKGSWAGIKVEFEAPVNTQAEYQAAKDFYAAISAGEVKTAVEEEAGADYRSDDEVPY